MTDSEGRAWQLVEPEDPAHVLDGGAVTDLATGVTYRATIAHKGRNPYLSSLQIDAPEGVKIDSRFLASVPTDRLADAVAQYLDAATDAGAGDLVILPPQAVQGRGFVPDLEELAAKFQEPGRKRAEVVDEYGAEYGVRRATVYRWISKARDAGLIPEATTGRPRKSPGGNVRRANREKETDK